MRGVFAYKNSRLQVKLCDTILWRHPVFLRWLAHEELIWLYLVLTLGLEVCILFTVISQSFQPVNFADVFTVQGQVFINGFNVGRYWPVAGPQITLYVPAGLLHAPPAENQLVVLELESSPSSRDPSAVNTVEFVDEPLISGRCFHASSHVDRRVFASSPNELPNSNHVNSF